MLSGAGHKPERLVSETGETTTFSETAAPVLPGIFHSETPA